MKFALSLLCEHPHRKSGLSSLFVEMVERSLRDFPELEWVVYLSPKHDWSVNHERLQLVREYPGGENLKARLAADHFRVGPHARRQGAEVLVTVGFVPILTGGLPVAMHMLSLQHLSDVNGVGGFRSFYRKWAASSGLRRANVVITNTDFAISQILAVNPEVKNKIVQSYEGLQHEFYLPEPELGEEKRLLDKFSLKPGYLYWCSNFYPYKQAEKFFDAYATLSEEEQNRLPIVMVGGGGWSDGFEKAMEHAKGLGIEHRVTKLGWVDDEDLAMLYRQSKMFCLASREETFGRCVIEAMACGIPCVVNDIPVMHEVTAGYALIVNFDDAKAGGQAFRKLLEDERCYKRLAEQGAVRSKDFDFDKLAAERVEVFKKIIEN